MPKRKFEVPEGVTPAHAAAAARSRGVHPAVFEAADKISDDADGAKGIAIISAALQRAYWDFERVGLELTQPLADFGSEMLQHPPREFPSTIGLLFAVKKDPNLKKLHGNSDVFATRAIALLKAQMSSASSSSSSSAPAASSSSSSSSSLSAPVASSSQSVLAAAADSASSAVPPPAAAAAPAASAFSWVEGKFNSQEFWEEKDRTEHLDLPDGVGEQPAQPPEKKARHADPATPETQEEAPAPDLDESQADEDAGAPLPVPPPPPPATDSQNLLNLNLAQSPHEAAQAAFENEMGTESV